MKQEIKQILIDEIAERLPVNKEFTVRDFMAILGMKRNAASTRIFKLKNAGLITEHKVSGYKIISNYTMSELQREKMHEQHFLNKLKQKNKSFGGKEVIVNAKKEDDKECTMPKFDRLLFLTKFV